MSTLHSHSSLIFNSKTTVKSYSFTSFLPSTSISSSRFTKHSKFSIFSSFNVPKPPSDGNSDEKPFTFVDEWGEKSELELRPMTKLSESDPTIDVEEWGKGELGIEDEWGEKSGPELRPVKTVSDLDPTIDEDEWIGAKMDKPDPTRTSITPLPLQAKLVNNNIDPMKHKDEGIGAKMDQPDPTRILTELGMLVNNGIDPLKDAEEWIGAKLDQLDPTRIHTIPLSSLSELGKLVGNHIDPVKEKDEGIGVKLDQPDLTETHTTPLSSLSELGKLVDNHIDPLKDKDEGIGAKLDQHDLTPTTPLPSLSKLGKLVVNHIDPLKDKDEGIGAKLDQHDLIGTPTTPLPSLSELGKLVDNHIDPLKDKDEGIGAKLDQHNLIGTPTTPLPSLSELGKRVDNNIDLWKDKDEWIRAKMGQLDPTGIHTAPLPSLSELGKLVGKITAGVVGAERVAELKMCLLGKVYGTDFGFRASSEGRAEVMELVSLLEAVNPTPNPVESPELLDGKWILVFTAFSELLPLLAVGTIPSLKVEKISLTISTSSLTIENSTTLSIPIATLSFSATAAFEVQSPSRIQACLHLFTLKLVAINSEANSPPKFRNIFTLFCIPCIVYHKAKNVEFNEGTFKPPKIKSKIDLPENLDIFGQNISLSLPIPQSLNPLENVVAGIAQTISDLPPLKVPIPGERTKSWLITTYLDHDLRISRGDGGLFVFVKNKVLF